MIFENKYIDICILTSNFLQLMLTWNTHVVEQVGIIPCCKEGEPHHREWWGISVRGVRKDFQGTWPCVRWFGGVFKEAGLWCGLVAVKQWMYILINLFWKEDRVEQS